MTEPQEVLICLQVLLYSCVLLKAAKPHLANPLSYATYLRRQKPAKCRLKVQRIAIKTLREKAPNNLSCELDLNAVVVVSEKTALQLELRNGQWQRVIFGSDDSSIKQTCGFSLSNRGGRWVQVVVCPDVIDKLCLVSPVLYHNLRDKDRGTDRAMSVDFVDCYTGVPSETVKKILTLWNEMQGSDIISNARNVTPSLPNLASEVHVKVIDSARYKYSSEMESLLIDYFRIPKLVCLDDTLVLPVPNHLAHDLTPSNTIVPPKAIYVKVIRVLGKSGGETKHCVHVCVGSTNLYLTGTQTSSFPSYTQRFNNTGEIDVPPLLRETYLKLRKIMCMVLQDGDGERGIVHSDKGSSNAPSTPSTTSTPRIFKRQTGKEGTIIPEPEHKAANHNTSEHKAVNHIKSASILVLSPPGQGSEQVVKLAASALGLGTVWVNCWQLKGDTSGATEAKVHQVFVRASSLGPCVLVLQDVHCLAKDRDGEEDARVVAAVREEAARLGCEEPSVVLVATAPTRDAVSDDLWSVWSYQECVEEPGLSVRCDTLKWLLPSWLSDHQSLTLGQRTAGFLLGDFVALMNAAMKRCLLRVAAEEEEKEEKEEEEKEEEEKEEEEKEEEEKEEEEEQEKNRDVGRVSPSHLQYNDLLRALDELQASRSEALGAPHIPQVQWGEVGGLEGAKRQIINTIQLPLRYPSLVAGSMRHSGVLLYGPPGTGKTLLAKAVATECGLNFLSVKGPELLNMYVGQSEENVRQVFKRAQAAAPCVVFFDELDSLAPNRGHSGDSGGVMDRIVSALLAELDGAADAADVFVLAATNRPDLLDPALLRPGRFEKLVYVGVCEDHEGQVKILKAVTSKIPISPSVSLERVASQLPLSLTGADMYALVTDALYTALHRCINGVRDGLLQVEEAEVLVTEKDFEKAAKTLVPSVSPRQLAHYHSLNTAHR